MSTYESWRQFAAAWGVAYFGLIFFIALVYALLPSNRTTHSMKPLVFR